MEGRQLKRKSLVCRGYLTLLAASIQLVCCAQFAYGDDLVSTSPAASAGADQNDQKREQTVTLSGKVHHNDSGQSDSPHFSLFGRKMTSEDYRSLNYGILGMVTWRSIFSGKQTVTEVYDGCPAALAGIRPGDIEIQADDHVWTRSDDQRSNWNIADGEAGTPIDIVIKRHGELLTFHLVRMNIEDIQNNSIRRMFERMLLRLGPPKR
jgi:C-terminal processing protease CtpA/Prc